METSAWELLLPEGMLEYFEVASVRKENEQYLISLVEKNVQPGEFTGQNLSSKGFLEEITIKDFPIRGRACYLKVKRRRWLNQDMSKIISRDWELVAKGTRMTKEFATFLKELHRYHSSKL